FVISIQEEETHMESSEAAAIRRRTDGLIIAPTVPASKSDVYRTMINDGTRIVLIDRTLEGVDCPMVTTDNIEVGVLATERLIKLGHRRIGHLRGTATSTSKERLEGYKQALSNNNIAFD